MSSLTYICNSEGNYHYNSEDDNYDYYDGLINYGYERVPPKYHGTQTMTITREGHSPYMNPLTYTWWQYDDYLHKYIDTGIKVNENNTIYINEHDNALTNAEIDAILKYVTQHNTSTGAGNIIINGDDDEPLSISEIDAILR